MHRKFEGNEDWIKRDNGRIPTKGATAARLASAGLGTSDDDASPLTPPLSVPDVQSEPVPESAKEV